MYNIFLYKLFIGVKKINGHSGVNFSFKAVADKEEGLGTWALPYFSGK